MNITENTDDDEPQYEGYTAEKFEIIKDSLARLSFFQFWYNGNFYRADGLEKTVRPIVNGEKGKEIFSFKNYHDLMNSAFLSDEPFKKLVESDEFKITAF